MFFFFAAISLFACEDSNLDFSCNPDINRYIVKNFDELSQLCPSEIFKNGIPLQRAIFNTWTPDKKREVWHTKLHNLLENHRFSNAERCHVQLLLDHIDKDYFRDLSLKSKSQERSLFAQDWISFAANELGWDNIFIAFMVFRLYDNPAQLDEELSNIASLKTSTNIFSESNSCSCSSSADFCGSAFCNSGNCNDVQGCGWLWSMTCDGLCY